MMSYHFYPEKFAEALKRKNIGKCSCGATESNVCGYHFLMHARTQDNQNYAGIAPYGILICANCGHTSFYSLMHENFKDCYVYEKDGD